jgi:hypothetical protein
MCVWTKAAARFTGWIYFPHSRSWGLRPRLYAVARFASLLAV